MKTLVLLTLVFFATAAPRLVRGGELSSPISAERAAALYALKTHFLKVETSDYKRNRLMQTMGLALMAASAAMSITGAFMAEGSPYGPASVAGIASVGVGLAHFIAGAFLMGLSKSVVIQQLRPVRPLKRIRKTSLQRSAQGDIYFWG